MYGVLKGRAAEMKELREKGIKLKWFSAPKHEEIKDCKFYQRSLKNKDKLP